MELQHSLLDPISESIIPTKRKSSLHYGFHSYFTTQPYNVVQKYIEHFSGKKDLVADPFCGSGVTAVESLRTGRRAFATDLNPFAVFLTQAKCDYVEIPLLIKYYSQILKAVEDECQEVENLSDKEEKKLTIPYWYPPNVELPSSADVKFLHELFTKKQLYQLAKIKSEIDKIVDCPEKRILLIVFCTALSKANLCYDLPDDGRAISGGQFTIFSTGRYRIPKKLAYIPVLPVFKRRIDDLIKAKQESNIFCKNTQPIIKVCSATDLRVLLKDGIVDYVYTDPPYGGHIAYLDLSIIYNSWLGFSVDEKMKKQEAIEGGEQKQNRSTYFKLLQESFSEISRILKSGRWCSLVFQHKEPSLWTNIVETAKDVGLEFKNTVVQNTKLPSWHKIDVPQSVMSCQMIINFIKKESATFHFADKTIPLDKLILDVAEREILKRRGGATLEEIINSLVPELFIHNISDKSAQTKTDFIKKLLNTDFDFDKPSLTYRFKKVNEKTLGSYIPMQEKIKMYLVSYMKRNAKATLDQILAAILPSLINGRTPSDQEILDELNMIANYKNGFWVYREGSIQKSLHFEFEKDEISNEETDIPYSTEHNQMIFRLATMANKYGFNAKVGNTELKKDKTLRPVNKIQSLKHLPLKSKQLSQVNEIDCLWFAKRGDYPIFAFEVEHSTTIDSAFERFISLLKANSDIGNDRRLILVISRKKKKDFNKKIKQSSYIGSPHYLNNKIRYIYEESLIENYEELMKEKDFTKFEGMLVSPELE